MKTFILTSFLVIGLPVIGLSQTNTATSSGSIGKCGVWDYPYTLYNNGSASETINNGVTVTVDQDRSIGSVNLSGTGTLDFSGANGISMSGSGSEITCRWDLESLGNYTLVNNLARVTLGTVFTVQVPGNYIWARSKAEWTATISGAYLAGYIGVKSTRQTRITFEQYESGRCGKPGASPDIAPVWNDIFFTGLRTGDTISYFAGVASSSDPSCNDSTLSLNAGSTYMLFEN